MSFSNIRTRFVRVVNAVNAMHDSIMQDVTMDDVEDERDMLLEALYNALPHHTHNTIVNVFKAWVINDKAAVIAYCNEQPGLPSVYATEANNVLRTLNSSRAYFQKNIRKAL